jgi:hypothetical protein
MICKSENYITMKKIYLTLTAVFVAAFVFNLSSAFAQDDATKIVPYLCKTWQTEEVFLNGKAVDPQDITEIVVTFNEDGTYKYWEENEPDDGVWILENNGTRIVFDKGTSDEMFYDILLLEAAKLEVKFSYEKKSYKYTFKPKQNQ